MENEPNYFEVYLRRCKRCGQPFKSSLKKARVCPDCQILPKYRVPYKPDLKERMDKIKLLQKWANECTLKKNLTFKKRKPGETTYMY